ncbi:MAG: hypothetical protein ACYDGM_05000 [Vulcanimicrobiaceae bacterium]
MRISEGQGSLFILIAICAAIAGCGGGSGRSAANALPPVVPLGAAQSQSVTITVPRAQGSTTAKRAHAAYVSANTQSIGIVVTPPSASPAPAVVANVPGPQCTPNSSGYVCTISVQVFAGINGLAIKAYQAPNASGAVLAQGNFTFALTPGVTPSPPAFTLGGVIGSIALSLVQGGPSITDLPIGESATLNVSAADPSGAAIVGIYDTPIQVSLPANSGMQLTQTSFPDSTSASATLSYTGAPAYPNAPLAPVVISATGDGATQQMAVNPQSAIVTIPIASMTGLLPGLPGMLRSSGSHLYALALSPSASTVYSIDTASGAVATQQLPFMAQSFYVDTMHGGFWFGDVSAGDIQCETAFGGTPSVIAVPGTSPHMPSAIAAGTSPYPYMDITNFTLDSSGNMWAADTSQNTVDFTPVTGACAATGFTNLALPPGVSPGLMIGDPSSPRVWIAGTGASPSPVFYAVAAASSPVPVPLPVASAKIDGWAPDGLGDIDALFSDGTNAYVGYIPSGSTAFSSSTQMLPNISGHSISTQVSSYIGGTTPIIGVSLSIGAVGLLNPTQPVSTAQFAPLPAPSSVPVVGLGMAFDGAGMPWALSFDGMTLYAQKIIATQTWNLLITPSQFALANPLIAGVVGGPSSLGFAAVSCTGVLTGCAQVPGGFPRIVSVGCSGAGSGSISVTDSASVTRVFPVVVPTCAPPGTVFAAPPALVPALGRGFRRR